MTLLELYTENPHEALRQVLNRRQGAFLWISRMGVDGITRYGQYRTVTTTDLVGRTYLIEYWDGMVSIHFLDSLHDPKTQTTLPL